MKRKIFLITIITISVLFLAIGSTLAYFTASATAVNITKIVSGNLTMTIDGGGNTNVSFLPAKCTSDYALKRTISASAVNTSGGQVSFSIGFNASTLSDSFKRNTMKWVLTTESSSCISGVIASGNFTNVTKGTDYWLIKNDSDNITRSSDAYTKTYYLYIWLDEEETSNLSGSMTINMIGKVDNSPLNTLTLNLNGGTLESSLFTYSGSEDTYIAPYTGTYKLEVWGAQGDGGNASSMATGGYGGYSTGEVSLTAQSTLYVNVGGKGNAWNGGYNGGGIGSISGGGATHIATVSGILSTLGNTQESILIVAGGGGGEDATPSCNNATSVCVAGGSGGGYKGTDSIYNPGYGGTQTAGGSGYQSGSFGQGGNSIQTGDSAGAGGGGFYGGGACVSSCGGGSGYIGNSLLTNKAMYCYNCTESSEESTKTVSTTNVSSTATSNYAKSGNGYARITYLGE